MVAWRAVTMEHHSSVLRGMCHENVFLRSGVVGGGGGGGGGGGLQSKDVAVLEINSRYFYEGMQ
eukprot:5397630-Amphidinium_carterae.1